MWTNNWTRQSGESRTSVLAPRFNFTVFIESAYKVVPRNMCPSRPLYEGDD